MLKFNAPEADDIYLFHQGNLHYAYRMMGAHLSIENKASGVRFTVWAPHAADVRVTGDFNGWDGSGHGMEKINEAGLWTLFIPGIGEGVLYKYEIWTGDGRKLLKSDPYAFFSEERPATASVVERLDGFEWTDKTWQRSKKSRKIYNRPMLIYEVHLGSWRIKGIENFYTYEELADSLVDYALDMGFTHLEFLPLGEHPLDASWGYQTTGYYSVTSRYGTPEQFKYLVNRCHERGLGVIMDWVPGHFCRDDHGLRLFDGSPLFEYDDERKADKPIWGTLSFDFGRPEVISFLISNAIFWMDVYHIDGLRVDAVASMMELNFDKPEHMWTTNSFGGSENLEATAFLRKLNEAVFHHYPDALMIAEDSSDRPLISAPTYAGGFGFNYKWNMGWMNDILKYMKLDRDERSRNHNLITFSLMYAYSENFILPFSHDEVVHGKKSLLDKMPGDYWAKFANLRVLYAYLLTHPGKKLLFMGGELAQFSEWKDREELDWLLMNYDMHRFFRDYAKEINHFYLGQKALWELDHDMQGFEWIDPDNSQQSIISFIRRGKAKKEFLVVVCNFTAAVYHGYRIGVPAKGEYVEVLNSDMEVYGGSGQYNGLPLTADKIPMHNQPYSLEITIPPLGAVILKKSATAKTSLIPQKSLPSSAKADAAKKPKTRASASTGRKPSSKAPAITSVE